MNFGIWQVIYLIILFLPVGVSIVKHGEPKEGEYHALASLISVAIDITLLALGGFFSK